MSTRTPAVELMVFLSSALIIGISANQATTANEKKSEAASANSTAQSAHAVPADDAGIDDVQAKVPQAEPTAGSITPYDFPVDDAGRKAAISEKIGNPAYPNYRVGQLYGNNLPQVYHDFNLDPSEIMTCDARHQQALDIRFSTAMMKQARNYFCKEEFDTPECRTTQYRRVYRGYCLDVDDSMDWLALQAAVLNAHDRSVHIPPDRTFYINQALIIPSNTKVIWLASGQTRFNGRSWERPGASFVQMRQEGRQLEPIDNFRKLGFSVGTVVAVANMPFVYSGKVANLTEGIAEGVELYYPHIDAGSLKGENAISMAQSVQDVEIVGGVLKNVKINATDVTIASAGGKAIQCEAGCREVHVSGVNILNSHIGINSNVIDVHKHFKRWDGRTSDIIVDGVFMENVDIPINVFNNLQDKTGSQRVHVGNFYFHNSGRMSDSVYQERYRRQRGPQTFSARVTGRHSQYFPAAHATGMAYDSGLVSSRGGYSVIVQNGKYYNDAGYGGIDNIVSGWGTVSKVDGVEYNLRFNCTLHPTLSGC